jgi:uncharacterized protein DUF4129
VARTLAALLLLAGAAAGAQARDALQAIDDCVGRLDTGLDVGYARIADRCPDLKSVLSASPWAPWLPADWSRADNQLSAAGLSELRTLLVRAAHTETARPTPLHTQRVAAVVAAVMRADDERGGWWPRFKDWLRRILAPRGAADEGWLSHWLARINPSAAATELLAWGALALMVALAAGILINELRLAGFPGLRARRRRAAADQPRHDHSPATLAQIERAALTRQPALLLELIAERLADQQRLPPARALTARELGQRARLGDETERRRLAELVNVCERLRFSAEQVGAESVAAALRSGRCLLAALDAPPAAQAV